jgi:hypothetical protein
MGVLNYPLHPLFFINFQRSIHDFFAFASPTDGVVNIHLSVTVRSLPSSLLARSKRPLAQRSSICCICAATGQAYAFGHTAGVGGQVCAIVALVVNHVWQGVDDVAVVDKRP